MDLNDIHARYINFYTDFAFKKLFGSEINKELLISFLNSLFAGKEVLKDLHYLNSEQLGTLEADRKAVFDVYCENEKGEKFIVEMQKGEQQFFKDRSVFYSTFPIREQAKKGDWNYELKKVYTVGILNFSFDDSDTEYFHHEVKLMDTKTNQVFFEKLVFIYLEMPKFTKSLNELETIFDKWMYVIKNLAVLSERPVELQGKVFNHLFQVAEISALDRKELEAYEASLKNYRDWYSVLTTAQKKYKAEGIEEGIEIGVKKGVEMGVKEGRDKERLEMAKRMKELNVDASIIAQTTQLSLEEISKL
jgi:predicted transposase/invertase (TIGR01784 family)